MDTFGVWVGFFGLFIAAVIALLSNVISNRNKNNFELTVSVRNNLYNLYKELLTQHSIIMELYNKQREARYKEYVLNSKEFHKEVMLLYNDYRVYYGRNYAYELESALYNYYYEKSNKKESTISKREYEFAHQSLQDSFGLLFNETRATLVRINNVEESKKTNADERLNEYNKYSDRIIGTMSNVFEEKLVCDSVAALNDPFEKATCVVIRRLAKFNQEYKERNRVSKIK